MRKIGLLFVVSGIVLTVSCGRERAERLTPFIRDGKYGYKNSKGEVVIEPRFDFAFGFSEGLSRVNVGSRYNPVKLNSQGGKWGYVDCTGAIVIEPRFEMARDFSGGVAEVFTGGRWVKIDKSGQILNYAGQD